MLYDRWHITQATLFCSQNSPVNHGNTRKRGNSCIFKLTSGQFKNVEIQSFFGAPHAAIHRFARSPARAASITLLSPSEDQMSRSHRLPPHRRGVASSTHTELEQRNVRNTLENQRETSMRPWSVASTMALSSNREQYATPAVHRHASSTRELTGTVLGITQLSLLENVQEAVKKHCILL